MKTRTTPAPSSAFRADVIWVPAEHLEANDWNPNKLNAFQYAKLHESILNYGFVDPLLIRRHPTKLGEWQIVDGEHRFAAGLDLGMTEFPCIAREMSDAIARKLTLISNELHGQSDPTSVGELLKEILASEGPSELLVGLPYTEDILGAFLGQPFPTSVMPESPRPSTDDSGTPKERWVERTYRMPASVAGVLDDALAKARRELHHADGSAISDFEALEVLAADFLSA